MTRSRVGPLPRAVATLATALLLVAGGLASLAPWWGGAGPEDTAAGTLLAIGRATGLLGGYLLVVEVALVARTPWAETRVGADRVLAWHRGLGETTVVLLLVHAVTLVLGLAAARRVGVADQTAQVVLVFPGVLTATIGTVLLIIVGVSSVRAVRARMRWERWHGLHLLAYAGVGLGFSHQVLLGQSLAGARAVALWTGLHLVVAAAALWCRVLVPLWRSTRHRLHVAAVVEEGPGTISVLVGGRRLGELGAVPGQFFRWRFLAPGTWGQAHPFSLSAAPAHDSLRITVRTRGDHAAGLAGLRPGTRVIAEGPSGALGGVARDRRPLVLVGGGVGVTPLRALLDAVPAGPTPPVLLQRATTHDDLLFTEELADLERRGRVRHVPWAGASSAVALDAAALRSRVPDIAARSAVVCGPVGMMRAAVAGLREAGVPRRRIRTERFRLT